MCGILIVRSTSQLNHQPALEVLKKRGPDYTITQQIGNVFIAQTVLHITGTPKFYFQKRDDGFAYNGEIYNYKSFGPYDNDVELAYETAKHKPQKFKEFTGPWAWCHVDNNITYASDAQGERCLYHYRDENLLIICSEVAPILTYIANICAPPSYSNKAWTMIKNTPWRGIERCEPGRLYVNGFPSSSIDSIFDWISPSSVLTLEEASEEFDVLWRDVMATMQPIQHSTVSYSGGVDSSLILHSLKNSMWLTVDIEGKDHIVEKLNSIKLHVTPESWAYYAKDVISTTKMPLQSWSDVGVWIVSKYSPNKITFSGIGADELFGGYDVYQHMSYDAHKSYSPYSETDHDFLWCKCISAYDGDPKPATLLMDYLYEVVGADAPASDRLVGCWGQELRCPFLHQRLIKFALNLPWEVRVGVYPKLLLRRYFQKNITSVVEPKKGFAGHANDSLPWLDVEILSINNRDKDWKQIAEKTFIKYVN